MAQTNVKAITHIPGWVEQMEAADRVSSTAQAYAAVPLVFRVLRLRCDSLASVPVRVTRLRGTSDVGWPFPSDLGGLIWKTEAALLMTGAAYWLILHNRTVTLDVQWLNPLTMSRGKNAAGIEVWVQTVGAKRQEYTDDEIVYFQEFDLRSDAGPGVGALEVALGDNKLMHYMTRFAAHFFEGGAQPVTLLAIEGNPAQSEIERVEGRLRRAMQGLARAFRVIGLRASIKPQVLTPPLNTLAIPDLDKRTVQNIAWALGIPLSMLLDAANYATASRHDHQFWQTTIRPRGVLYEGVINNFLKASGYRLEMAFDELDVFQVDEAERSQSLLHLVAAGMPLDVALDVLGYDLTAEQRARVIAEINRPEPVIAPEPGNEPLNAGKAAGDLRRWERKSLKRLREGRESLCGFESANIPASLAGALEGALEALGRDPRLIRAIFADARKWEASHAA